MERGEERKTDRKKGRLWRWAKKTETKKGRTKIR